MLNFRLSSDHFIFFSTSSFSIFSVIREVLLSKGNSCKLSGQLMTNGVDSRGGLNVDLSKYSRIYPKPRVIISLKLPSIILEELMWSKSLSIETIYSKLVGFWCLIASYIATICYLSSGHRMNRGMSLYESFSNSSCSLACMYSWWTSFTIYWSFAKWWKSDMPWYWILKASITLMVFLMAAFLLVCFPTSYHSWISFWVLQ